MKLPLTIRRWMTPRPGTVARAQRMGLKFQRPAEWAEQNPVEFIDRSSKPMEEWAHYNPVTQSIVLSETLDPSFAWKRTGLEPEEFRQALEGGFVGEHELRHGEQHLQNQPDTRLAESLGLWRLARETAERQPTELQRAMTMMRYGDELGHDLQGREIDADTAGLTRAFETNFPEQPTVLPRAEMAKLALLKVLSGRRQQIDELPLRGWSRSRPFPEEQLQALIDRVRATQPLQPRLPW